MQKFIQILFLLLFTMVFSQKPLDQLLIELDNSIAKEKVFTHQKQLKIKNLLKQVSQTKDNSQLYPLYKDLSKQYEVFVADSAQLYTAKALEIANKLNNETFVIDSQIQLARIKAKAGMFNFSLDILNKIKKNKLQHQQLVDYYKAYLEVYIYWAEYQDGREVNELIKNKNNVQDSLINILPKDSYEYAINYSVKYIELKDFSKAEKILLEATDTVKPDTREFSILNSILAYLYQEKRDRGKEKFYLAKSAISDIHAAVKENISLRTLAILLFDDGETGRANLYIKQSLEDANFYNARLRNIQIARVLPIIDKAYQMDREKQERKLRLLLIVVSVLSVILLIAIIFVIKQIQKVSKAKKELTEINSKLNDLNTELQNANDRQALTNRSLAEANHIKEEYIKSFLEICTEYIDRLENFKNIVNRKIKTGQTADIIKMTTTSAQDSTKELKELYNNFDKAFLKIYPDFVVEINKLLRPEEQYPINNDQNLNQELRVFALIRLGVTNNNQIATFLHYTLRTIYNYRSKVKSKAIHPDDNFEQLVQRIGISESLT
jgi:acyl carrier protein phosphodiesterase